MILPFFIPILYLVTVLKQVSCQLETERQLPVYQFSTPAFVEKLLRFPELRSENTESYVLADLNKNSHKEGFEINAGMNADDTNKYKHVFEEIIKGVSKAEQALKSFGDTVSDKSGGITLQETKTIVSSKRDNEKIFESKLNSNREARNYSKEFSDNRINGLNQIFKTTRVYLFQVAVIISKPKAPRKNFVIFVPLTTDMTVLDAFVSATRTFMVKTSAEPRDVPYNVVLDWDNELQCYIVMEAVGVANKRKQAWVFTVKDSMHMTVYKNRCLPDDDVILRPRSSVQLTYRPIKQRFY